MCLVESMSEKMADTGGSGDRGRAQNAGKDTAELRLQSRPVMGELIKNSCVQTTIITTRVIDLGFADLNKILGCMPIAMKSVMTDKLKMFNSRLVLFEEKEAYQT